MTGYHVDTEIELAIFLLLDGENWRTHSEQLFGYHPLGSWDIKEGIHGESLELPSGAKDFLMAVEGAFIALADRPDLKEASWSWDSISAQVVECLQNGRQQVDQKLPKSFS